MDELEELKRKRLAELQRNQEEESEVQEVQKQIEQLETLVKLVLTKEALIRYGNIKAAHPQRAVQLLIVLGQAVQSGKLKKLTDAQLKNILQKLTPEKKETKIRRV